MCKNKIRKFNLVAPTQRLACMRDRPNANGNFRRYAHIQRIPAPKTFASPDIRPGVCYVRSFKSGDGFYFAYLDRIEFRVSGKESFRFLTARYLQASILYLKKGDMAGAPLNVVGYHEVNFAPSFKDSCIINPQLSSKYLELSVGVVKYIN